MPQQGHCAAAALLTRRFTDEECTAAADRLIARGLGAVTEVDIRVEITTHTQELPSEEAVQRLQTRVRQLGGHIR